MATESEWNQYAHDAEQEISELRAAIERLREEAKHGYFCQSGQYNSWTGQNHPCNCGYDALMADLEETK